MPDISENNKRIAKNTLLLYFRMALLMAVNLYISRVVLNALGVEDFGIYNVVGGIVIVLTFLNTSMAGATQRFLNVEMASGDDEAIKRVFDTAQLLHLIVSAIVLILAETLGLWFLNACMNIPPDRMVAANWVYQFSVVYFIANVISVPYNAAIIAHERMAAFAYISIYEASARLGSALLLTVIAFDKLIAYGALIMLVQVSTRIVYGMYCSRHFVECRHFSIKADKPLLKSMSSFSSWTIVGSISNFTHIQGIAFIINLFFGVFVNAAQGIANQVNSAMNLFVSNFLTAMNPQVVKNYAAGDLKQMHLLVFRGCRFTFFSALFLIIPLVLEAPIVLRIWLKTVPDYTVVFVRLVLLVFLAGCFGGLLSTAQGATGEIKKYQLTLTSLGLLHLPFTALFYWMGFAPQYAMYVYLAVVITQQAFRIRIVSQSTGFKMKDFYKNVVLRCGLVLLAAAVIPTLAHLLFTPSIIASLAVCAISVLTIGLSAMFIGMTTSERKTISEKIVGRIIKQQA